MNKTEMHHFLKNFNVKSNEGRLSDREMTTLDRKTLYQLINLELEGIKGVDGPRESVLTRLHQRYCSLWAKESREKLLAGSPWHINQERV